MKTTLKKCNDQDVDLIRDISEQTYEETFRPLTTGPVMEAYLKKAFDRERIKKELSDPDSVFYLLEVDDTPAGYMKLNYHKAQTHVHDESSLQIERLYLFKEMQSKGLGSMMIEKAFEIAKESGKIEYLWLNVWEKNIHAIAFYKKYGFELVGFHSFFMGPEEQNDYFMRSDLF